MPDIDYNIWNLVQNVISEDLDEGKGEKYILEHVMKLTHGMVDYDIVEIEIRRQTKLREVD